MALSEIQSSAAAGGTMDTAIASSPSTAPAFTGTYLFQFILNLADRWRKAIFVVIALTYFLGFNGQWRIGPDSGLYLDLSRSLATGNGYTYHGIRHETVYPGL